jgi:hypothetical protein
MSKIISIVSDWSASLGSGHIQRMMNLARLINSRKDFKAYIINQKKFIHSNTEFDDIMLNEIHPETSLIIRDMRDSLKVQIEKLKKISPVLVIDDLGQGADYADFKINILPDPATNSHDINKFLYGYNFSESIKSLCSSGIQNKDIDIAFYTGYKPEEHYISTILKLFPDKTSAAVLSGEESFLFKNGERKDFNMKYSEALVRSKIMLSHFGLTIYEGFACGALPMTINPTDYHMTLTEIVKKEMGIVDIGLLDTLDKSRATEIIKNSLSDIKAEPVFPQKILNRIESASNEFYEYLLKLPVI